MKKRELSQYFDAKLRALEFIERELVEIWSMLSDKEKRNEKQFYQFLDAQRSARLMKEALASIGKHYGYFKNEEMK